MGITEINLIEETLRKWNGESAHFTNQGIWSTEVPSNLSSEKEEGDSDFGKDLAKDIREYYLLNFENWKDHDEYKSNFSKLVAGLKIENHIKHV